MSRRPSPLDNEQCKQCTSFSDYLKSTQKKVTDESQNKQGAKTENGETVKGRRKDCPLDREELGRAAWGILHTMAAKYPEEPNREQQCGMKSFFKHFSEFYPCRICSKEFKEELQLDPPKVESRDALSQWLCQIHNKVNVKLGKEIFDCSKVNERWRDGWLDGSCDY